MIKKIIHVSDTHIPNSEKDKPYYDMLERFLSEVYSEIKNDDKDSVRILFAGDTFEQKIKVSNEAQSSFHKMLNFCNAMARTYIFAGNHDMLENNHDRLDSISPTFEISDVYENVTYLDRELDYQSGLLIDDNVIWVLYSIFDKFKCPDLEGIREKYPNHKIIGLYHGNINGAVTDIGVQIDKGIDTDLFKDCDCIMAGHIHKFQEIKRNGVPIVYSGSLFQQNCGENVTGHGFVVWDLENMTYKHHEVQNDYRIYKFKINSYDDVKEDTEQLMNY